MNTNIKKLSLRLICASTLILSSNAIASIQTDLDQGLSASQAMQNAANSCSGTACMEQSIKEMINAGIPLDTIASAASSNGSSIKMITSAALTSGVKIGDITMSALNVPGVSDRLALEQVIIVNDSVEGDNIVIFQAAKDAGVAQVTISQAAKNAGMSEKDIIEAAATAGLDAKAVLAGIQVANFGNATAAGGNNNSQEPALLNSNVQPRSNSFGDKSTIISPLDAERLQPSVPNNVLPKKLLSPN